jgi:hypothetical protein
MSNMNPEEQIEKNIMSKIKEGDLEQRSKYIFVAEKFGLLGIIGCSVALAIGLSALVAFSFKASRAYDYLRFGVPGIPAFFEAVPVLLLILLLVVFAATFFFFMKTDVSYKKPLTVMVIATLGFILLSGGAIAYVRSEKIQASLEASHFPARVVRPWVPASAPLHKRGVAGEVVEVGEEYVALQTPRGNVIIDTASYGGPVPVVGDVVIVVGGRKSDVFQARGVRILHTSKVYLSKEPLPLKFTLPEDMAIEMRDCFEACLQVTRSLRTCRSECAAGEVPPLGGEGNVKNEIQIRVGL